MQKQQVRALVVASCLCKRGQSFRSEVICELKTYFRARLDIVEIAYNKKTAIQ